MKPLNSGTTTPSILIVDDTPANLQILSDMLKERKYKVRPVSSGKLALQAAIASPPDLILLDINMPRMNGFELTAKIRADKAFGDLPVVLVTALASQEDRERGIDAGANAYIVKSSFDQSNLLEVMKKLI